MLAAGLLALCAAPAAQGNAVTVGATTLASTPGFEVIAGVEKAPVFQGDAGSGYTLSSPATGTITSWSFMSAGVENGKSFVLRVLRPAGGEDWTAVATSPVVQVTGSGPGSDALQGPFTAGVSLPIQVGDRIALEPTDDVNTPIEPGVIGADGVREFAEPFEDGATQAVAPASLTDAGQVVPIQATVQYTPPTPPPPIPAPFYEGGAAFSGTPAAGKTLTCVPGTWLGAPLFSYTWSTFLSVAGPKGTAATITLPLGTGQTLLVPDLAPGTPIACTVIATNLGGLATANPFTGQTLPNGDLELVPYTIVLASTPVLSGPVRIDRRTIPALPQITPGVGVGGTNSCSPGIWQHHPSSYSYQWQLLVVNRRRGTRHMVVLGTKARLQIPGLGPKSTPVEGHSLRCMVTARNSAGAASAFSNSYIVPTTPAPKPIGAAQVFGTATPRVGPSPPANPDALRGNSFVLSCLPGRWNRKDLKFSPQWVFDRTAAAPQQLSGLIVQGENLDIKIDPPSGPLLIDGLPPLINGVRRYGLDYLSDSVQCEETATAPNGLRSVQFSAPVALSGPVAEL